MCGVGVRQLVARPLPVVRFIISRAGKRFRVPRLSTVLGTADTLPVAYGNQPKKNDRNADQRRRDRANDLELEKLGTRLCRTLAGWKKEP
jgi:hypothetical protein